MASLLTTEPLPTPTLASAAADALRADILAGVLLPRARLGVEALRSRYQMGASPLREALSQLVAEGLVVRVDQRGFRVADAGPDALEDLVATRVVVETAALAQSIACAGPAWEEAVLLAHHRLQREKRSLSAERYQSNPGWELRHREFHLALVSGCGAPTLIAFCRDLHDRATRFRNLANQAAWTVRDPAGEHAALTEAALARDAPRASALLAEHYRLTARFVADGLGLRGPRLGDLSVSGRTRRPR